MKRITYIDIIATVMILLIANLPLAFAQEINPTAVTETNANSPSIETSPTNSMKILDDNSKFTRYGLNNIGIKKENVEFNITSDINIQEIGDISVTKEWGYNESGTHYEIVASDSELFTNGGYLCSSNYRLEGGTNNGVWTPEKKVYDCIYYPPEFRNVSGDVVNARNLTLLTGKSALIQFQDYYDPISQQWAKPPHVSGVNECPQCT